MSQGGIQTIMGGAGNLFTKPGNDIPQLLDTLSSHQVTTIDTAVIYGDSEELLGSYSVGERFTIDTKNPGGFHKPGATKQGIQETAHKSLEKLKLKQVDILYLHAPDVEDIADTLAGLNELYKAGAFRRLGLSNFTPAQVQEVYDICQSNGYPLPKVYQGNYNAFARSYETTLLPLLRKLGLSFYAYSPQAGGFLSKTSELVNGGTGEGRLFGNDMVSDLYRTLYKKPVLLEGLTQWNQIAQEAGIKGGDMAVRWVKYNSPLKQEHGDALIIGGRTLEQVNQTLSTLDQGPLPNDVVKKIDGVWDTVKDEAPVDNYHDFVAKVSKQ